MGDTIVSFGLQVRIIRGLLKWDQDRMAECFAVSRETISRWETEFREPRAKTKRLLAIIAERNEIVFDKKGFPERAKRENSEPPA